MINKKSNQQKPIEYLTSRKKKPTSRPLADLIKQINEMGEKAKTTAETSWQPEPPLAA